MTIYKTSPIIYVIHRISCLVYIVRHILYIFHILFCKDIIVSVYDFTRTPIVLKYNHISIFNLITISRFKDSYFKGIKPFYNRFSTYNVALIDLFTNCHCIHKSLIKKDREVIFFRIVLEKKISPDFSHILPFKGKEVIELFKFCVKLFFRLSLL